MTRPPTALAALLLALLAATARGQEPAGGGPGRIQFHGKTAAVGAGFGWGASTLEFQGKTYPVRVDGFVLGAVGAAALEASGTVTGLTKAEDLNGDFTAVSTGVTVGEGVQKLLMRNDKGVRIVMDGTSSGFQLGLGPRGIALTVGEAGGPPADEHARLPQTLGFGEMQWGHFYLEPTLNAQLYFPVYSNPGFGGQWSFGPVERAGLWFEHSNEEGLNARYVLGDEGKYGTVTARVSGLFSMTTSQPDGPVCNTHGTTSSYSLESLYGDWKSGDLFPSLGHNALEISGGNQNYQVFDGLMFWDGGQDCSGRGANWLSARKAFKATAIAKLTLKDGLTLEAFHLKYNDHPSTDTELFGERMEWATDDFYMKHLKVGFMYFHIYNSRNVARDGMNGAYFYNEANPFPFLPDFSYKASFVRETNSGLPAGYGWYAGVAYEFSKVGWTPKIGYRYASFSEHYDGLFTGLPDWGSWFQGEILGEYVLSNNNLLSHQFRLTLKPTERVTTNLIYYHFLLDNRNQPFSITQPLAVSSRALADEVDLIFDVTMTNWWSITATLAMANPNKAFTQAVNGSGTWVGGYVYMNFNF